MNKFIGIYRKKDESSIQNLYVFAKEKIEQGVYEFSGPLADEANQFLASHANNTDINAQSWIDYIKLMKDVATTGLDGGNVARLISAKNALIARWPMATIDITRCTDLYKASLVHIDEKITVGGNGVWGSMLLLWNSKSCGWGF